MTVALLAAAALAAATALAPAAGAVGDQPGVPQSYLDQPYPAAVNRPSADKPQSKLWFHAGSWWALMASTGDGLVRIHALRPDHTWADTGTLVDSRLNSTGDALFSGSDGKLWVANRATGSNLQVNRFSFDTATRSWSADAGFPVSVNSGGSSESATIDRDSLGRLWVTYTRASRVWVAHSIDATGQAFTAGFQPTVPDTVIKSDDLSAVITFNGSVGVLWSDQQSSAFRFAIHNDADPDGVWRVEDALNGPLVADDHVNLKQLVGDPQGRIFAAVKTSANDAPDADPTATLTGVLVRTPRADGTGAWETVPAGTVADDYTRPIIAIDSTNQELYFFATAPGSGGDIYYKKTPLANPSFGPGRGDKFVDTAPVVNNASSAKDPVTAESGMVVLASAEGRKRYAHGEMALGPGTPPPSDTTAPTVPAGLTATASTGQVGLSWNASTDDVAVAGYDVLRDGTTLATVTGTGYTDTAVTAGQSYTYTVEAFDAAGNRSGRSGPAGATVPGTPSASDITFRAVSTAANSGERMLDVPAPERQSGDLLLASVDFRGNTTVSPPAGWQLLRKDAAGTDETKITYWRVSDGAEPATVRWQFSKAQPAVGSISAYSGVSTTTPIQASAGQVNASSRSITTPSVTTTAPREMVVSLYGIGRGSDLTTPPQLTARSEIASPTTIPYKVAAATADHVATSAGGTGTTTATSSVTGPSVGQTVALTPAG